MRTLRITYWDNTSSFNDLLEKGKFVSNYHKNLQTSATEMYKKFNNMCQLHIVHSVYNVTETLSYSQPIILSNKI